MTSITVPAPGERVWTAAADPGARRGIAAVVFFFFVLWTNLAVVLTQFHGVPQIVASSVVVVLLIPIVRALIVERQPPVVTPVLPLVLIFLSTLFLAGIRSPEPSVVQNNIGLYLTEGLLLYLLVSNAVRTLPVLTAALWTLILAGALMGGLSVFQEFTHTYACLLYTSPSPRD